MTIIKKKYSKPVLGQIKIDNSISLIMTSDGSGPGDPFGTTAAPKSPPAAQGPTQMNSFNENPFGE